MITAHVVHGVYVFRKIIFFVSRRLMMVHMVNVILMAICQGPFVMLVVVHAHLRVLTIIALMHLMAVVHLVFAFRLMAAMHLVFTFHLVVVMHLVFVVHHVVVH